ncbi:polysaccharide deacetylase family protein [Microvirga sp. TS319]|uniref:polysaccharide deacetylase family protein n=1 Tax=Microvirga sp. TS319 TaxID=3241165 RepID=UPI00351A8973
MSGLRQALECTKLELKLRWQRLCSGSRTLVLGYHRIADLSPDPFGLAVSPRNFAEHLEVLSAYNRPILFRDIGTLHGSLRRSAESVCVTFDDGYADNLHTARPLLEKYDIPATFFVTAGQIGSNREFWWDEIDRILERPGATLDDVRDLHRTLYEIPAPQRQMLLHEALSREPQPSGMRAKHAVMTHDELLRLADGGLIEIGAHSMTHPRLPRLPEPAQREEIGTSKRILESILGHAVVSFAYPFGAWTPRTAALVEQAGLQRAATVDEGTVGPRTNPLTTPRMLVSNCTGDDLARLLRIWFARPPAGGGSAC